MTSSPCTFFVYCDLVQSPVSYIFITGAALEADSITIEVDASVAEVYNICVQEDLHFQYIYGHLF